MYLIKYAIKAKAKHQRSQHDAYYPCGYIRAFSHNTTLPKGWLECDGRRVSAKAYPDLVKVLCGSRLPDLCHHVIGSAYEGVVYVEEELLTVE